MGRPKKLTLDDKDYFTIDDLAQMLGVAKRTIEREIQKGNLAHNKIGKSTRISRQDVEDYLSCTHRKRKMRRLDGH